MWLCIIFLRFKISPKYVRIIGSALKFEHFCNSSTSTKVLAGKSELFVSKKVFLYFNVHLVISYVRLRLFSSDFFIFCQ